MFKPFYWLDIAKTENMLSEMSAKGRHLKSMNFLIGTFDFEEGEPCKRTYIIRRSPKCRGNVPKKLVLEGCKTVCGNKKNYAAVFEGESETCPSYRNYRKMISIGKVICAFVICYIIGLFFGISSAYQTRHNLPEDNEKYISSAAEFADAIKTNIVINGVLFIIAAAGMVIFIRSGAKYDKLTGDDYDIKFTIPSENFIYSKAEEKQMLKDKTMLRKTKTGWYYSPDKGEEYIEKMELGGWNFYRFGKMGNTFYFVKGRPRKVKFVVDYQHDISDEYLSMNTEDGWKLQFKSVTKVGGYIMWLKEYADGEEEPQFFSDNDSMRKRSKRLAIIYGAISAVTVTVYALLAWSVAADNTELRGGYTAAVIAACSVIAIEYIIIGIRSILYYLRMRKKYEVNIKE